MFTRLTFQSSKINARQHFFNLSKKPVRFTEDSLLVIKDGNTVLSKSKKPNIFFQAKKIPLDIEDRENAIYIGELSNQAIFALEKSGLGVENAVYTEFHAILDSLNPLELKVFYRSSHLLNWHTQSRFCGHCGSRTLISENEFAKVCETNAQHRFYPQYSPSMIVLVRHEDKLLLGRSHHFKKGMYSTLAGFVEAGETVEEAVQREVMEEVGIEVTNIRPISSAPWPFPNSLMLAYEAEPLSLELTIDPAELEDAQWFSYDNLPDLPPTATISWFLINHGRKQCERFIDTKKAGQGLGVDFSFGK